MPYETRGFQLHSSFLDSWNINISDKRSVFTVGVIPENVTQFCTLFFNFIFCKFVRFLYHLTTD
jgi:hypothetical protein